VFSPLAPTVVVNKSITIYASKGSDPYLYCGVRYDKKVNVTYMWYFAGDRIDDSSWRYKVDKRWGRLTISSVSEVDNGIYRCDSSSGVGDFSTTIELVVQGRLEKRCCILRLNNLFKQFRHKPQHWQEMILTNCSP
jgi:hypothetical protein